MARKIMFNYTATPLTILQLWDGYALCLTQIKLRPHLKATYHNVSATQPCCVAASWSVNKLLYFREITCNCRCLSTFPSRSACLRQPNMESQNGISNQKKHVFPFETSSKWSSRKLISNFADIKSNRDRHHDQPSNPGNQLPIQVQLRSPGWLIKKSIGKPCFHHQL